MTSQTNSAYQPLFAYTGQMWDAAAALYYYHARWYDPHTGRFISQDPTGFAAGDPNLYRYVGNSPTIFTDRTGLEKDIPGQNDEGEGTKDGEDPNDPEENAQKTNITGMPDENLDKYIDGMKDDVKKKEAEIEALGDKAMDAKTKVAAAAIYAIRRAKMAELRRLEGSIELFESLKTVGIDANAIPHED